MKDGMTFLFNFEASISYSVRNSPFKQRELRAQPVSHIISLGRLLCLQKFEALVKGVIFQTMKVCFDFH